MKNILITGGSGFIGSRLTEKLVDKGYNVTILDNLSPQIHTEGESVLYKRVRDITTFLRGDVRNKEDWKKAIKGQDIVVHLASETGTGQSMYQLDKYNDVNIMGTSYLLDLLIHTNHSIKKMVIASSRAIYGEGKYLCKIHGPQYPAARKEIDMREERFDLICETCNKKLSMIPTDELSKIHPTSIYGINKQQQEQMMMLIGKSLNIPVVSLRYQNVYGPGQSLANPYTGILAVFSTRILNKNNLDLYEDGFQTRDFVYIDDAVDATILAIEKKEADGEIFNVGYGEAITIKEVAKTLKKSYNSNVRILINSQFRLGDIRNNVADIRKIQNILGFNPRYNFQDGILKFISWVKSQEISEDRYEKSIQELKDKGLLK